MSPILLILLTFNEFITCFYEFWKYESTIFFHEFLFVLFFCKVEVFEKEKKCRLNFSFFKTKQFATLYRMWKKNRRFGIRENMWWAHTSMEYMAKGLTTLAFIIWNSVIWALSWAVLSLFIREYSVKLLDGELLDWRKGLAWPEVFDTLESVLLWDLGRPLSTLSPDWRLLQS
jgi:hypothetical protein